jgi:hypothetical protein
MAQSSQEIDSIRKVILELLKKTPPPPDSVLQKKRLIRSKPPDSLYPVTIRAYDPLVFPSIFESAYFDQARTRQDSIAISFYAVTIGNLKIETGKIIACDPSRIYFSPKPVVRWEFALARGKRQIPLGGEHFYGYGVDGGQGIFIDSAANDGFTKLLSQDDDLWETVFVDETMKNYRNTWEFVVYPFPGHNLAGFSTGLGDGTYASYVGYDASGKICRLLTDFGLISWWKKRK